MGKWMNSYGDEVLQGKLARLVTGAVQRARLESEDFSIDVSTFAEELDTGDSFVASIVDLLVHEIADRHTRQSETDRRRISEKTARKLRQMTTLQVYRTASSSRRTLFSELFPRPPDEIDLAIDDEYGLEGTSLGHQIHFRDPAAFDVFRPPSRTLPPLPPAPDGAAVPFASGSTGSYPSRPHSSLRSLAARRQPRATDSATTLTRQGSLRRTGRARTTDFHDFTSRRRTEARDTEDHDRDAPSSLRGEGWSVVDVLHYDDEGRSSTPNPSWSRRDDLLSATWGRPPRQREIGGIFPFDDLDTAQPWQLLGEPEAVDVSNYHDQSPAGENIAPQSLPPFSSWFGPEDGIPRLFSDPEDLAYPHTYNHSLESSASSGQPRLRRGGIRAPEVIATTTELD